MTTYGQDYQGRKRKYYSITPYGKEQRKLPPKDHEEALEYFM